MEFIKLFLPAGDVCGIELLYTGPPRLQSWSQSGLETPTRHSVCLGGLSRLQQIK